MRPRMDDFSAVDRSKDPQAFVSYLSMVSSLDVSAAYKKRSIDLLDLRDGARVLEVGCGAGDEARAIAQRVLPSGHVTATDISEAMIAEARTRGSEGITFEAVDAHSLPYPDASFDAARVDRTLQHVEDPARVIKEMSRVLRAGRRLIAIEPDWDTLVVSGDDIGLYRRLSQYLVEKRHRQGRIGRQLPALFVGAGIAVRGVEGVTFALSDYETGMRGAVLREGAAAAQRDGAISNTEARRWLSDLEDQARRGVFLVSVTAFMVLGVKT